MKEREEDVLHYIYTVSGKNRILILLLASPVRGIDEHGMKHSWIVRVFQRNPLYQFFLG